MKYKEKNKKELEQYRIKIQGIDCCSEELLVKVTTISKYEFNTFRYIEALGTIQNKTLVNWSAFELYELQEEYQTLLPYCEEGLYEIEITSIEYLDEHGTLLNVELRL